MAAAYTAGCTVQDVFTTRLLATIAPVAYTAGCTVQDEFTLVLQSVDVSVPTPTPTVSQPSRTILRVLQSSATLEVLK